VHFKVSASGSGRPWLLHLNLFFRVQIFNDTWLLVVYQYTGCVMILGILRSIFLEILLHLILTLIESQ